MNAMRSDIYPLFSKFAKSQNLIVGDSKKAAIGKAIARKAAAFGAGYALGRSLEL